MVLHQRKPLEVILVSWNIEFVVMCSADELPDDGHFTSSGFCEPVVERHTRALQTSDQRRRRLRAFVLRVGGVASEGKTLAPVHELLRLSLKRLEVGDGDPNERGRTGDVHHAGFGCAPGIGHRPIPLGPRGSMVSGKQGNVTVHIRFGPRFWLSRSTAIQEDALSSHSFFVQAASGSPPRAYLSAFRRAEDKCSFRSTILSVFEPDPNLCVLRWYGHAEEGWQGPPSGRKGGPPLTDERHLISTVRRFVAGSTVTPMRYLLGEVDIQGESGHARSIVGLFHPDATNRK